MSDNTEQNDGPIYKPDWDWHDIERVLIIRLRSIGDAVLTTPSITALRRHRPDARIDILLEDWVAPVLEGHAELNNVISFRNGRIFERMRLSRTLSKTKYDLVYNMHGGSTSAFFTAATRAKYRIGFGHYRYSKTYTHLCIPSEEFWGRRDLQSAEQHLTMLGWTGVPVHDRPRTSLAVTAEAETAINEKLASAGIAKDAPIALLHPTAAFESKQWPAEKFAQTADHLHSLGFNVIAVAAKNETSVLDTLRENASAKVVTFADLTLPQITALASRAGVFLGNDSGIAHIAAAVQTPCVVIFGSSTIEHWRPYTDAPNEVVSSADGINGVSVKTVTAAIGKVLGK